MENKNYRSNREFLKDLLEIVELSQDDMRVIVTPDLQGRVMCSSAEGDDGESYGWINYKLLSSGEVLPHCNNYGGEDRFWLGPEGGQYALFFAKGAKSTFDFEEWQAPAFIDTERWQMSWATPQRVAFEREQKLSNCYGYEFNCRFNREVELLSTEQISKEVGVSLPSSVKCVGFSSKNMVTNIGEEAWSAETGALSVWMLGQFNPSAENHVILPLKGGEAATIKGDYFGDIPADRLFRKGDCYYFKTDGKLRGKLGVPPESTKPIVLALDEVNSILTVVTFSFDEAATEYVNSVWELQEQPLKGDVINAYNDGPLEDGTIMGGFYEIESSSKALLLAAGESHTHTHTTIHIKGELTELKQLLQEMI